MRIRPSIFIGLGNPKIKSTIVSKLRRGFELNIVNFPNLIHPFARLHQGDFIEIGIGNFIADSVIITTNVKIGDFNLINL